LSSPTEAVAKACCADLYQSALAKMILGDTLHPGGLGLTNTLGRLTSIQPGEWVVDLASARGTSALAVARVFHCNVVGVEFGEAALKEANAAAAGATPSSATWFVRGDAESPPFQDGSFDRALDLSMSLFMDKSKARSRRQHGC
jgi:arsenite methyltransferase